MLSHSLLRGQEDLGPIVFNSFGINSPAAAKRLYSQYTGHILSTLVEDIRTPDKYLENQLISRLGMVIYDDVSFYRLCAPLFKLAPAIALSSPGHHVDNGNRLYHATPLYVLI